jgi:hypothetical protein
MAEIRVFTGTGFLCRAICPELAGTTISLKDITAARNARRRGDHAHRAGGQVQQRVRHPVERGGVQRQPLGRRDLLSRHAPLDGQGLRGHRLRLGGTEQRLGQPAFDTPADGPDRRGGR